MLHESRRNQESLLTVRKTITLLMATQIFQIVIEALLRSELMRDQQIDYPSIRIQDRNSHFRI